METILLVVVLSVTLFLFWIWCLFFVARDARKRGMDGGIWVVIVFFLGILGLLIYLFSRKPLPEGNAESEFRKCPFCAEQIKAEAVFCKHCHKNVPKVKTVAKDEHFKRKGREILVSETGLVWSRNACIVDKDMSWKDAMEYVKTLNIDGHNDWRLPSIDEFKALIQYAPSKPAIWLEKQGFTDVRRNIYWSASENKAKAWIVDLSNHGVYLYDKAYECYVWPVRG